MKVETYYMNEFTGEVFTNKAEAFASEQAEAERIEKEVERYFNMINKYCENHPCPKCVFHKECQSCILYKCRL